MGWIISFSASEATSIVITIRLGEVAQNRVESALQFTNVGSNVGRDIGKNIFRNGYMAGLGSAFENGDPRLIIGGLNINGQSAGKTRTQSLFERNQALRGLVAGHDDVFPGFVQSIESVEKLNLHLLLAFDKLNIINQQHIGITIFAAEIIVFIFLDGVNKLIDKVFALNIQNIFVGLTGHNEITDCMHQMGFAEAGSTIEKKRIEVAADRLFGNSNTGGMSKAVAAAHHEGFKTVLGIEAAVAVLAGKIGFDGNALRQSYRLVGRGFRLSNDNFDLVVNRKGGFERVMNQRNILVHKVFVKIIGHRKGKDTVVG